MSLDPVSNCMHKVAYSMLNPDMHTVDNIMDGHTVVVTPETCSSAARSSSDPIARQGTFIRAHLVRSICM